MNGAVYYCIACAYSYERFGRSGTEAERRGCVSIHSRGTSLTKKRTPIGPYRRPVPSVPSDL